MGLLDKVIVLALTSTFEIVVPTGTPLPATVSPAESWLALCTFTNSSPFVTVACCVKVKVSGTLVRVSDAVLETWISFSATKTFETVVPGLIPSPVTVIPTAF